MATRTKSIVFIDAGVEAPLRLAAGIAFDAEILILSSDRDGVEQITAAVAARSDISDLYILAHGRPGELFLGNASLSLKTLSSYRSLLARWGTQSYPTNLHLYGCQVAAGDAGAEFLATLRSLTGANIAASSRLVGHAGRGGSWSLDTAIGTSITSDLLTADAIATYPSVLVGSNDFAGAPELVLVNGTIADNDDTTTADSEPGEPFHDSSLSNLDPAFQASLNDSIWWRWTAPASGLINATTAGSAIDAIVAVYTGTALSNLSSVTNLDAPSGSSGSYTFTASAGTTYFFAVDGVGSAQGSVQLTLNVPPVITPGQTFQIGEDATDGALVGTPIAVSKPVNWSIVSGNPDNDGDGISAFAIDVNGQLSVQDAGDLDFEIFDSFFDLKIKADDGSFSDTESVFVEVADAQDVPVIISLNSPTNVNEGSLITLSGQFSDPDAGDTQIITVVWGDGTNNTVISSDGLTTDDAGNTSFALSHIYRNNGDFSVSVTISDGVDEVTDTRTITVNNVAPTITQGDTLNLNISEDSEIAFQLKATDPSTVDELTYTVVNAPTNGTLTPNPPAAPTSSKDRNRLFTYTPNANFSGTETFQIQVTDTDGGTDTVDVVVEVEAQPDAPEALTLVPTPAAINEGESLTLSGSFADPDVGDTFTVTIDWGDGTESAVLTNEDLTFNAVSGRYSFAADHQYFDDTATGILVTVEDSFGAVANGTTGITINNIAPTITPGPQGSLSVNEDGTATITFTASDPADTNFTWEIIDNGTDGAAGDELGVATLSDNPTGTEQTVTYTAVPNRNGLDKFTIQVSDGVDTSTSVITVGVNPVNDAPINLTTTLSPAGAIDEGATVKLDGSFFDADNSADPLLDDIHTVTIDWGDGTSTVLNEADLTGTDTDTVTFAGIEHVYADEGTGKYTVTVTATDAAGESAQTTQDVTVNNVAPVILDPGLTVDDTDEKTSITLAEDSDKTFTLNATDVGVEDVLTWSIVGTPTNGSVELAPGATPGEQSFTYTPNLDYDGADAFTVQISDGDGGTDTIDVQVTVTPQNDPPEIITNQFDVTEGQALPINIGVLDAIDIDTTDDAQIQFTITGLAAGDTFTVGGVDQNTFTRADILNGLVAFQDNGDEVTPSFTIEVSDGTDTVSELANVTLTKVNDAPEIVIVTPFTVAEDGRVPVRAQNISATDEESNDPDLAFTVSDLVAGEFLIGGTAGNTFTLAQINQGIVQFEHDGSETAPSFTLVVSDGELESDPVSYVPGFSQVNDAPSFLANQLEIAEGGEVLFSTTELNATDIETLDNDLTFSISGLVAGTFFRNGTAIDTKAETFTLEEILLGAISFKHDGSETEPDYTVTVTDNGVPVQSATSDVTVTFTEVNDDPVISTPATDPPFTLNEDGTVLISRTIIDATDVDNPQTDLTFTVSNVTDGFFALTTDKTSPITSFEWEQVDSRQVVFVHDGVGTSPSYTLTVNDGEGGSDTKDFVVGFNEVNDTPTFSLNQLTIDEGQRVVLDGSNLQASDEESSAAELTYIIDSVSAGTFELNGKELAVNGTFTQQDVLDGNVSFVHDDSETPPTYSLILQDGGIDDGAGGVKDIISLPAEDAIITFSNVNDEPVLTTNFPGISEGETLPISTVVLSATDEETNDANLVYTVTTTVGSFQVDGVNATTFTQADIVAGIVDYVHDGSEAGPVIEISVADDNDPPGVAGATITPAFTNLNDTPSLLVNTLEINEGETVRLTTENLSAEDLETIAPDLKFQITGIDNGFFTIDGTGTFGEDQPTPTGSFLLRDIIEGRVSFTHDGSNVTPAYTVEVVDDDATDPRTDGPAAATITFNEENDAPELDPAIVSPAFTVNEGATIVLTTASINATDEEGETPQEALTFTVSNVENGFFAKSTAATVPVSTFTWKEVNTGQVVFAHQGSTAPSYTLTVTDEQGASDTENYTATLVEVNDAPSLLTNRLTIEEGQEVVLALSDLQASDEESPASELTYKISSVSGGTFEINDTAIAVNDSFTQQQVIDGKVSFTHDGGETAPTYSLVLSDGGIPDGAGGVKDIVTLPASKAEITFTNINDAPVLTTNFPAVSEGATLPIITSILSATDQETANTDLVYTVTTTIGLFQVDGVETQTFTQSQVSAGLVEYIHDGSEIGPTFEIKVEDTDGGFAEATVTPDFNNFNDLPTLLQNTLTIEEGQTVTLSTDNLSATDLETIDPNLRFDVTAIDNGFFTVEGAGVFGENQATTTGSFLLQDVIEGRVTFTQDGSNDEPVYTVVVVDDDATDPKSTGPSVAEVTFTATNDAPQLDPTIVSPTFEVDEESIELITTNVINATDEAGETPQGQLQFTVSEVLGGFFANSTAVTVPISTFTWDDVNQGRVVFSHKDSNVAPSYTLTVADEQGATDQASYTATLAIVNDAPQFITNNLALTEGDTVVFDTNNLFSTDEESDPSGLTYTIVNLSNGQFFLDTAELVAGGTFTQQDVLDGKVSFVHDDTNNAPSYQLTVTDEPIGADPAITIGPSTVTLLDFTIVNDPPTLLVNFPTVDQGAVIAIDNTIISASDDESAGSSLVFIVSDIANAEFRLNGVITGSFTQEDIDNNRVTFAHNGGLEPPLITLTLNDSGVPEPQTATEVIAPAFQTINTPPTFTALSFSPVEGDFTALTPANLAATDLEDSESQLLFTVDLTTLQGGQFFLRGVDISTLPEGDRAFTQGDMAFGQVVFKDDGDEVPPVISFTVTDSEGESVTAPATIALVPVNDAPTITASTIDIGEGGILVLNRGATVNIQATDPEVTNPAEITFTISELVAGTFFFDSDPAAPIGQFTQQDLDDERVVFVQDSSNIQPSFILTASDPQGASTSVAATVNFAPTNDAPVAVNDFGENFITNEDTFFITPPLTLNDTDEEGNALTVTSLDGTPVTPGSSVTLASGAIVSLNGDNSIGYDPNSFLEFLSPGESQVETFSYVIDDGNGGESTGAVAIEVFGVNDAPIAVDDVGAVTDELTPIVLDVLANDVELDLNDSIFIIGFDGTALRGQVTVNADNTLTYDPSLIGGALLAGETIEETFLYGISDTNAGGATGTVTVSVVGVNNAPVAVNDAGVGFTTDEDTVFVTANVLGNDFDPEGDVLTVTSIDASQTAGIVTSNGDGTFSYDPAGAFDRLPEGAQATDSFIYTVTDSQGNAASATATITINGKVEIPEFYFDYEQFLRYQNPGAAIPAEEIGGLQIAQLFDESLYLALNRDVAVSISAGVVSSGYQHFLSFGINEARTPNFLYDEAFYLANNADVADAVNAGTFANGLVHFLTTGHIEGRNPSSFFNQQDYLTANPDVGPAISSGVVGSAFEHYIEFGADEGRSLQLNLYSESFYLANNPDVLEAVNTGAIADGFTHFVSAGQFENRPPSTFYNEASYLALNPDIAGAVSAGNFVSGFQHYETIGRFEGRDVF